MKLRVALILLLQFLVLVSVARSEGKPFKKLKLKLYLYDNGIGSPNATGVEVAGPNGNTNTSEFGSVFVIDNQILNGPNFTTAKEIGRAKGTFMVAAVDASHVFLVFSAVIESKKYNGTIAFQGTDKSVGIDKTKELAVVGGTGDFRFADGYATYKSVYFKVPNAVTLLHTRIVIPKFL